MSKTWTKKDQAAALEEGWGLFSTNRGCELQRVDEEEIFSSDNDAVAWVTALAFEGKTLHAKAIALATNSVSGPNVERIKAAIAATDAWQKQKVTDRENMIRDLISDLCHLADFLGRRPSDEVEAGVASYEMELDESRAIAKRSQVSKAKPHLRPSFQNVTGQ